MSSHSPIRSLLVQHVMNLDTSKICNQYGIKKGELLIFLRSFILGIPPAPRPTPPPTQSQPELVHLLPPLALGFLC